ncbi:hypothetical protein PSTT_04927 [Puccinia striiformis]|uniref:Uncharacterized protein n=2 Tax=Puccinia striiformis TaxID=27350 RepID=A0A2S4VQZ5_9BASI|nr:hypothetical protein PSTT_04927 [Puccinia striiformis]
MASSPEPRSNPLTHPIPPKRLLPEMLIVGNHPLSVSLGVLIITYIESSLATISTGLSLGLNDERHSTNCLELTRNLPPMPSLGDMITSPLVESTDVDTELRLGSMGQHSVPIVPVSQNLPVQPSSMRKRPGISFRHESLPSKRKKTKELLLNLPIHPQIYDHESGATEFMDKFARPSATESSTTRDVQAANPRQHLQTPTESHGSTGMENHNEAPSSHILMPSTISGSVHAHSQVPNLRKTTTKNDSLYSDLFSKLRDQYKNSLSSNTPIDGPFETEFKAFNSQTLKGTSISQEQSSRKNRIDHDSDPMSLPLRAAKHQEDMLYSIGHVRQRLKQTTDTSAMPTPQSAKLRGKEPLPNKPVSQQETPETIESSNEKILISLRDGRAKLRGYCSRHRHQTDSAPFLSESTAHNARRQAFEQTCNELFKHEAAWFKFWTETGAEIKIPPQIHKDHLLRSMFPTYLFYVDMLDSIINHPTTTVSDKVQKGELFNSAIEDFEAFTKDSFKTPQEREMLRVKYREEKLKGEQVEKPRLYKPRIGQALWHYLSYWISHTGSQEIKNLFSKGEKDFKGFFDETFRDSLQDLNNQIYSHGAPRPLQYI